MDNPTEYFPRLRPMFVFTGLTDAQVLDIAQRFEVVACPPGDVLVNTRPPSPLQAEKASGAKEPAEEWEDPEAPYFYIIYRGQVTLTYPSLKATPKTIPLTGGDFFGEDVLLHGKALTTTVTADTPCTLLRLGRTGFEKLLKEFATVRTALQLTYATRRAFETHGLPWLNPGEAVYLIAQRHPLLLWQMMAWPIVALALALILIPVLMNIPILNAAIALTVGGIGVMITAGWAVWNYVDFNNDFYIVTNQRVIYLEKIVGLYDSRQESVLSSVQAVTVETVSSSARLLSFGDVVFQTFTGPLRMHSVAQPELLAKLVNEHLDRAKRRTVEEEHENRKRSLTELLYPTPHKPNLTPKTVVKPKGLGALAAYFDIQVRFERQGTITYRKHWYVLLENISTPAFFILCDVGVIGLRASNIITIDWAIVLLVALLALIPLSIWFWYQMEDWRNDLYQITQDQIVDIEKKPLGREERRVAQLSNILSLKYEKPGWRGVLLNYGNVVAAIPGGEFTFDGVFDPMGVQTDINRRMEEFKRRQKQAEAKGRRQEIMEWISAYHALLKERDNINPAQPPE